MAGNTQSSFRHHMQLFYHSGDHAVRRVTSCREDGRAVTDGCRRRKRRFSPVSLPKASTFSPATIPDLLSAWRGAGRALSGHQGIDLIARGEGYQVREKSMVTLLCLLLHSLSFRRYRVISLVLVISPSLFLDHSSTSSMTNDSLGCTNTECKSTMELRKVRMRMITSLPTSRLLSMLPFRVITTGACNHNISHIEGVMKHP